MGDTGSDVDSTQLFVDRAAKGLRRLERRLPRGRDGGEHDADHARGVGSGRRRPCRDVRDEFALVHLLPFP